MVVLTIAPLHFCRAQNSDPFNQAGADLTAAYKQAIALYPQSDNEEPLRKAERAWIAFSNKNEAVFDSLKNENLMSEDAHDTAELVEVNARTKELQIFFCNSGIPVRDPQAALASQEARLTSAYQACLRQLNGQDQQLLREDERAWIVYRDLNTNAVGLALHQPYDPPAWTTSARAWLDSDRADELSTLASTLGGSPQNPPTPNQPAGFDDSAAIGAWQKEAKEAIADLLSKKDAAFFGPVTTIKNAPAFPPDSAAKITAAYNELVRLRRDESAHGERDFNPLLQASNDDAGMIDLLQSWIDLVNRIQAGRLQAASFALMYPLSHKPTQISAEYQPVWDKAVKWQALMDQTLTAYKDHIKKAQVDSDLGKSADAISELNAAYSLFEDPGIAADIKKIRDASLGL